MKRGVVYLVGAGPGDPGLITARGLELIRRAEVLVYDRLVNPRLVAEAPAPAERIYAGKSPEGHALEQDEIDALLVQKALEGKVVVRLKGGDPFVFGRGGEEAEACAAAGIRFEIVPGITSAIAVPAYAGIPVTHRDLSSSFAVITGREDPTKEWTRIHWDKLANGVGTLVVLMGVETLPRTVEQLKRHGLPGTTPAALIEWGTEPRQRAVIADLDTIHAKACVAGIKSPAVTVIGEVARLRERLRWFDNRPLFGKRIMVTRSRAQASALTKRLEERGAEVIEVPTIEIAPPSDWRPLDNAIGHIGEFQWLIFTSVNAVEAFFNRLEHAQRDARTLANVKVCAIGPATAAALQARGVRADYRPDEFTTEGLAKGLNTLVRDRRVLLPRADIAPEDLVRALKREGAQVEQVTVYHTVVPEVSRVLARDVLEQRRADAVTFTSSSTVENLATL
ncbi:MAG: uroporphyrinogen-III C-methyltransferase, partial [Chloroflexi bacterium]|nr:uroporphyrinogen-III C-methyltransferase [Chloroflexota bacterium]